MPRRKYAWETLSDEQLLKRRLRSLRVTVEGSWLRGFYLDNCPEELEEGGIQLRPHAWISSEWSRDEAALCLPTLVERPFRMNGNVALRGIATWSFGATPRQSLLSSSN